jgi:MoaA/NifB/PqqE/SkfB family radical SAM enzyme
MSASTKKGFLNQYARLGRFAFDMATSRRLTTRQRYRLIQHVIRRNVFGTPMVRSIEIFHTMQCNGRCAFCSEAGLGKRAPVMEPSTVFYVLEKVARHGTAAVIFLGGESLTDPNIFEYISRTRQLGMVPLLQTNGSLLTSHNIERLDDAGIHSISITLYDTLNASHDSVVGIPGALEHILAAVPMLKQKGIEATLRTIYSPQTVQSGAFDRIRELSARLGTGMNVNPLMPVGGAGTDDCVLSAQDRQHYLDTTLNDPIITTHTKGAIRCRCPAAGDYLGIFADGEISPCGFLPISVGNVRDISIEEARSRCLKLGVFRDGVDSCVVGLNEDFYHTVIKEIYSGQYTLPVRVLEHPELIERFSTISKHMEQQCHEPPY